MADWQEYLSRDPEICGGELCAKGTRVPVTVILDGLGEGSTTEAILTSYPSLRPEHIQASLAYAAELAHEERLLPAQGVVKFKIDENLPMMAWAGSVRVA